MGYTHYWQQKRDFTAATWKEVCEDIRAIIDDVANVQGIALADGNGDAGTSPEITDDRIFFNGVGDDSHETLCVYRKRPPLESWQSKGQRGSDFCKTARKPYDIAVVAVLAYLASIHDYTVSSDGNGTNWLPGVELARRVVKRYANQIDIPLRIRQDDRWDYRSRHDIHVSNVTSEKYDVRACIDGHVYVYERGNEENCYRFENFEEAKTFFASVKEAKFKPRRCNWGFIESTGQPLFATSGSYDQKRHSDLARQQSRVLSGLLASAPILKRNKQPPAFARPRSLAPVAKELPSLADLFDLCI